MSCLGKKFLLLILAVALALPAAACGAGSSGSGGGEDSQPGDGVPFYGEAIDRAQKASDKSEQRQREIEENLEEAAGGY